MSKRKYLGFGLGLRPKHYEFVIENKPKIDWFEVISENFLIPGGNPLYYLTTIRQDYPIVLHGVSMSIGGSDPLDWDYLKQLKHLADRIDPPWMSDHLCWTGINGTNLHDLMPLPYTENTLKHVVERIKQVQDFLGRQFLIENVSSYVTYKESEMSEWEFLTTVVQEADCHILLDVNNIYVSSFNHGFDPLQYLNAIPIDRVQQFHIAGHTNKGTHIIDTHDHPIVDEVWELYAKAVERFGHVSTMIERDDNIPEMPELMIELDRVREIANHILEVEEVTV